MTGKDINENGDVMKINLILADMMRLHRYKKNKLDNAWWKNKSFRYKGHIKVLSYNNYFLWNKNHTSFLTFTHLTPIQSIYRYNNGNIQEAIEDFFQKSWSK